MNFKKIIFSTLLAAGCIGASAQQQKEVVVTEEVFAPHWYLQGQFGFQNTLGEVDWADLVSPNAQLGVGYQFTPLWGARLTLNAWQSKAGSNWNFKFRNGTKFNEQYRWDWNYIAPSLNGTLNLTNLIWGYKPDRRVNLNVFAGAAVNFAFNNDKCQEEFDRMQKDLKANNLQFDSEDQAIRYKWDNTKPRLVGQFGGDIDVRLNDRFSVNLEVNANALSDRYNSKKAGNSDWYINYLLGAKMNLGKTHKTVKRTEYIPVEVIRDTIYIHDTIYVNVEVPANAATAAAGGREQIRRDLFFVITGSQVSKEEQHKVDELVEYLNKYPEAKLNITGYADKGTGNPTINKGYAKKRAETVANLLVNKYGISRSRLTVDSKGDTEQPYAENDKNRVTICISE